MRTVNSHGNRLVALVLSIVMVLGMFPVGTVTSVGNGIYGNVTTLTGGSVTGNGTENVEVIIEETTLQWVAASDLHAEGWWVGIDVAAPEGYAANATYKVKSNPTAEYGDAKSFAENKDGESDIQLWFAVSPESLKKFAAENRNLIMTYAFDWNGDSEYEQTIVFSVNPKGNIVLKKDSAQVYPVAGTVSTLTGGAVIGNGTANVEVVIEETTLQWVAANNLRAEGWWVGIDVVAPDGYATDATYKVKSNPTAEYGEEKSFVANKDGENDIQLWFAVSPESLTKFESEGRNLTMTYAFDWDADGSVDQTVAFSVKPSTKIVLQKDGEVIYPLGTVTTLTGGSVAGNGTENVEVLIESTTLQWVAANSLRAEGWWVGIDVVAPDGYAANATYKVKSNPTAEYGEAKSFADNKDGEKDIQLWFAVSPESLNKFIAENRNLTMTYAFDWDGDGAYEQTIVFSVKPSASIVLKKGDVQLYPVVGTVNPLTGGTVTGNGTTEIDVVINETTLQWVEGNNLRAEGWWVGIDVIAPDSVADNATYKVKSNPSAEYSEAKSFADNKDGEKNIELWFAVSPESLEKFAAEGRDLTMTYTFDWDGDGVYDQTIVFSVNPNGDIRLKKGSVLYYPELGNVSTYTGGTVTGNKTSDVSVVIDEAVLQWSPADSTIGRNQDGWWVGIQVEAPAGFTAAILQNAKYQTKGNLSINWDDITEVKSFWTNKDSNDSAESQYIECWFPVTPASLEKFKNENRNITMVYRFDWEGDGEYDQSVTFSVVPSDKIVLTKVEQTGFGFVEPNPVDKWVGESYTNIANGGQGTGAVTYAITDGADVADIDAATGELTFKKVGTVTVTATKAADDTYAEATATYTVKTIKYPQAEFKFSNSNPVISVGFAEGSFANVAAGGSGEGAVTYSIISGNEYATIDENTGKITFIKAGTVTVVAKKAADTNYNETIATYTLTIEKSEQNDLAFSSSVPTSITYNVNAQSVFTVSGGNGNGGVTYSIIAGKEYATINNETGAITILKAGGSFTVQVDKAGDDGYIAAKPITTTIYVEYAEQKDFDFAIKTPADVIYNDNGNKFTNAASGGLGTGAITYAFADTASDAIADIDAVTGELTILAAGTIKVVATKAGDDCYKQITAEYTLKVEKDTPEFTVGDVQLVYGATEHQINVNTILGGSGKYLYSIEGSNNIGANVDENGKITFENSTGKVGTITVKVKKETDAQYVEAEKTFTLTVFYHQPSALPTVTGDAKNESGWYTGVVTIHAPEGYKISYSNDLTGTVWSDTVAVNTDGDNSKNVYLMKGNEISDAISFESIKIDTAAPVNVGIKYDTSFLETVLEAITFGIYQADEVTVTLTATDLTSGVDYFTYNIGGEDIVVSKADFTKNENGVAQYRFTIPAQFRNKVTMKVTDVAGWTSEWTETEHTLVVDTISPELDVKYEFAGSQNIGETIYSNNDVTVKFEIKEANFDLRANDPIFKVGSMTVALTWTYDEDAQVWKAEQLLSGDNTYDLSLTYSDESGNQMTKYEQKIIIDSAAPVISSSYGTAIPVKENIFNTSRTATFTITESNFNAQGIVLTVTAKDITGADVDIVAKSYTEYARNPDNWTSNGNIHTVTLPAFDVDAIYSVKLEYTDLAKNDAITYTADFVVDKTVPANIQIKYSTPISDSWSKILNVVTFGYYPYTEKVEVTLIADDITSGVDFFTWTYTKEANTSDNNKADEVKIIDKEGIAYFNNGKTATASFVIDAQARGYISVDVTDEAGNTSSKSDNTRINVVDTVAPTRVVSFAPERVLDATTLLDVSTFVEGDNVILYYEKEAVVTFTINEANFYAEDVVIKVNGVEMAPADWAQDGDIWTGTITISGDGDYVVTMTYTDRSTNEMVGYQSQKIAIDNTDPTIAVDYTFAAEDVNVKYYKADCKAVITINDHNFVADNVVAVITAVDVQGNKIENADTICAEFANYLKTRSSWTHNGDVHTAEITFSADAQYTFQIDYRDIIGNSADSYVADPFAVDHADPTNLKIEYSNSVVEKIIEAITFGFYKPEVIVTLTADDITSGVDYFDWTYTQETGTSGKNEESYGARIVAEDIVYSNSGLTATATFVIPANARGYISATVTDRAGYSDSKTDDKHINIVDNIAPTISVKYEADKADTLVQFADKDMVTVDSFEKAVTAYYSGNVTAKIVIDEANFFEGVEAQDGVIYNVGIKLTKTDDNGDETIYEYLPAGAVQKYADAIPQYITWTNSGDEHSFNINYTDNADYVLEIDYTDLSSNDANISANDGHAATKSYKSKVVTVDKIAPVVSVKYSNEKVIHTVDGRDYFDAEQTATITVEEHNFRADDFAAIVTAQDILGDAVTVEDFKATLSDDSKWLKNGDIYTITIQYSVDANYTFDVEYQDLAQNRAVFTNAEENDPNNYKQDLFTVDTTNPVIGENPLSYSDAQKVIDTILGEITFHYYYYGDVMTVEVSVRDATSPIHVINYACKKTEGTSAVNASVSGTIQVTPEMRKADGTTVATFTIPSEVLDNSHQFHGSIDIEVVDKSGNSSSYSTSGANNTLTIVVDNIKPNATITYSAPVQNANNISYYAGNIDAKIVINEANFYSEDVVVTVTRDGDNYPVNVKWVDDSVDVHTGTFTLTADGDYIVTVEYKDRSDNQMAKYTSNRLTLDTKAPSVSVSNIKNNSANKDEKYEFTITANDINLDASSFKPVLTATVRKDDGSYETKTVSLGDMKTVEAGKTYTFTVDNLEEDAIYSLVCTLKDMSGNQSSEIILSDNESYDEVRFSINRGGSTFAVDKNTDTLVNQYYVYSVDEDVVIEEVNVDPVETYVVKLNGEKLTEGTDYTTTLSNKDGEWSKRTYIISKNLFKAEGEYSIVVESTDKAETTAYSDVKNLNVSFVVDQTAPVLTISGLENGGRYQVEEQIVTIIPTDDGGRLYSIKVVVLKSDGKPIEDDSDMDISVRFEMSGEEFLTYLAENGGKVTFTVPDGIESQVQIICNDYAVNADGNTNEVVETFTKVTVSQSRWIIFYANKTLFYSTIAGVVLLVGAIFFLIFLKKRKKEQKK